VDAPRQDDGATPLYTAAYGGHTAVVELLPAAKAGVDTPNQNGATPLYVAAQLGHCESLHSAQTAARDPACTKYVCINFK
jgi:ankyrin repeat protein